MFRNNTLTTRRETTDVWQSQNPILDDMELGVEIILNQDRTVSHYNIKLGDGITQWNSLDYFYENLNEEDTNEILDDFTINLATRKPVANRIPIYDDDKGLKSGKEPVEDDDVLRLKDLTDIGTSTPTPNKLVKYNEYAGLKSDKVPNEDNDVARYSEVSVINNEISTINNKLSTLNGAYYVLDPYNFGKTLDETNPDDIHILNTYAIASTPGASSMADVYNDTVIINEFDTSEFVYNKIADIWVKYPNGYLTIAANNHLGVVKGTQPPADPTDKSKDAYIQVLADGAMKLIGGSLVSSTNPGEVAIDQNKGTMSVNKFPFIDIIKSGYIGAGLSYSITFGDGIVLTYNNASSILEFSNLYSNSESMVIGLGQGNILMYGNTTISGNLSNGCNLFIGCIYNKKYQQVFINLSIWNNVNNNGRVIIQATRM
jgi:hypothetical protein